MKKIVLSVAAMLTLDFAAQAQISIIPKVGASITSMAFSNEDIKPENLGTKTGYVAGLGFDLPVAAGMVSIQPEVLFIQKGFTMNGSGMGVALKITNGMNYLEIPVLAKVSFGGDVLKAYVNAGPSVGYALGGRYRTEGSVVGISVSQEGKIRFGEKPSNANDKDMYVSTDEINRTDIGVQLGGGIGIQAGPGSVLLDLRYGLGLSNFYKGEKSANIDADGKNRAFVVSLGYAIPFGN